MKGIQDTSSETLRQLLANGLRYEIPKFQRDYSWDSEQWDDLWLDIISLIEGRETAHYMGYLVLQTANNKEFKVIDGQQRLTTLSILVVAVLNRLQALIDAGVDVEDSKKRQDSLRSAYIGSLDPVTLLSSNKLRLNRNNDDYYRDYLVPLQKLPSRGINASSKLMGKCFSWYDDKLKKTFKDGVELARFVDTIVDKLFFTSITVSTELNAFIVFETLNSRGVQLSSADLLKNYLFSVVDSAGANSREIEEVEWLWTKSLDKLGGQRFPEFLRTYWNSRNKTARKNELFKVLRSSVSSKPEVFELLRNLNDNVDVYMALKQPEDEMWGGHEEIRCYLAELKMFNIQQPLALLLGAHGRLRQAEFVRLLRACVIVSMRYNVIGGFNPNDQETVYNDIALRINDERRFKLRWFSSVYPSDESFRTEFSSKQFKHSARYHKIVKYILASINKHKYGTRVDWESDAYSVEHILPEHPDDEIWHQFDDEEVERLVYRLGNMTLLKSKTNKNLGRADYQTKKAAYEVSDVALTRAIAEHYNDWTEDSIIGRQRRLAELAVEIWKL